MAKSSIPKINIVKNLTLEIWYAGLGHLNYEAMQKLVFIIFSIELKVFISLEIGRSYIVDR